MRILVRAFLVLIFLSSVLLAGALLHGPKEKETWAALTGLLAVIAAVVAVLPALRVLEIQEDVLRPRPTPYFDLTSRYGLLQLRVENLGGGVAYDVQLKWKDRPVDHEGNEVASLDRIAVLLPQRSVSRLVGTSSKMVKEFSNSRFEGECSFRDSAGKRFSDKFVCSVDASLRQLHFDEEMPKTLHDIQEIPKELNRIGDMIASLISGEGHVVEKI